MLTLQKVVECSRQFYARGWMWGTAGNLSVKTNDSPLEYYVTASGINKGELTEDHFVRMNLQGQVSPHPSGLKPSAETWIHQAVYESVPSAGAVFHVHAMFAALTARKEGQFGQTVVFSFPWFEMLKAVGVMEGMSNEFPVFANWQDIPRVGDDVKRYLSAKKNPQPALFIHDHGMTVWGRTPEEARNHVEAMEYICEYFWRANAAGLLEAHHSGV
jgi:methylthioribulose-1-phosphate dehydratase